MGILADLVQQNTSTTGTGTITLGSAVTGFRTIAGAGIADGSVVSYAIQDGTNRETGTGTVGASGTTLTRNFLASSTNALLNLSGSAVISIQPNAADFATNLSYTASTRTVASSSGTGFTIPLVSSTEAGLAPSSGGGTSNFLRADGSWAAPPVGAGTNLSYTALTRAVASSTGTGFTLPLFSSTDAGLVPLSGGGTSNFLRADGTFASVVTSVGGTGTVSGLTLTGSITGVGNLTLGGTLSVVGADFGSQTANFVLAAPNGSAGNPSFRALVAADIPTLNQNTTGSAATLTTTRSISMSGDVTWSVNFNGSANATAAGTIANAAVTNAKMADMPASTFKGRVTGTTGAPEDMTAAQATSVLNTFTSTLKGLVPASGGGTGNFLRADGLFVTPPVNPTNISYTASTRAVASSSGTGFTFPLVSSTDAGLAPASGGGTSNFLRADGSWTAPPTGAGTNISYTASTRALASSTGSGFTFPLFSSADAGLSPASGGGTANFLRADGTWTTTSSGSFNSTNTNVALTTTGNTVALIRQNGASGSYLDFNLGGGADFVHFRNGSGFATMIEINTASGVTTGGTWLKPQTDNAAVLGFPSARWSTVYAATGTINTSDAREKNLIEAVDKDFALDFVSAVNPKFFKWKVGKIDRVLVKEAEVEKTLLAEEHYENGELVPAQYDHNLIAEAVYEEVPVAGKRVHAGFFAQEVKAAMDASGKNWAAWGLDDVNDPDSRQNMRPDQMIPILWAAVQKLTEVNQAMRVEIDQLTDRINRS